MEKLYSLTTCLKWVVGDASSLDPPLPALITMSLTTSPLHHPADGQIVTAVLK